MDLRPFRLEAQVSPLLRGLADPVDEDDRAFARLEDACRQGTSTVIRINSEPLLDPLKRDARFVDLVRRLNLPWS